jgi:hypothetical protein
MDPSLPKKARAAILRFPSIPGRTLSPSVVNAASVTGTCHGGPNRLDVSETWG